jgi:hypothetical protein
VTTSAVLTQNLVCSGSGIIVGASGITIDLGGYVLRGDQGAGDYGIDDTGGHDSVTIKNGAVRDFQYGVYCTNGADKVTVSSVVSSGNALDGIVVLGASAFLELATSSGNGSYGAEIEGTGERISSSTMSGNAQSGLAVQGDLALIRSSTIAGNVFDGVLVAGTHDSVASSRSSGNGRDGIVVVGDAASLNKNLASGNGFPGGVTDLTGVGIHVFGFTTAPSGSNTALGNDDPAECVPALPC